MKTVPNATGVYKEMIKFKFIDSFRFMALALEKLSSLIPFDKKTPLLRREFPHSNDEQISLLERKGILCYEYIDSWQKLRDTTLPPQEAFFSSMDLNFGGHNNNNPSVSNLGKWTC